MKGTVTEETNPIPVHPFAKAHLEAEGAVASQSKHIEAIIIRCANSFGAPFFENEKCWGLVVNDLCKSAFRNGRLIINSSGQSYRNFIAADDVVRAIHQLLELNNKRGFHDIYNLGSSNTVRIIDIAKKIQKELEDSFDYDCPIETKNSSTENNKEDSFIFSIKKILQTGFRTDYSDKEISSLTGYCRLKYYLDKN